MSRLQGVVRALRRIRRYRTSHGFWGVGYAHGPAGGSVQLGPWVWTTELHDPRGDLVDEDER
jgi:hypothetical protein